MRAMPTPARFLMSPPDHYRSHFMFNPWLDYREDVDRDRAERQWSSLVDALTGLGAGIEVLEPNRYSSAQVFTADGAVLLRDDHFLILRNDGARGVLEPSRFATWLEANSYTTEELPPRYRLDGGNIVRLSGRDLAIGMKPGAAGSAERYLGKLLGVVAGRSLTAFRLVDRRFLHLDMVLGRLGDAAFLMFEEGFEDPAAARAKLEELGKPVIPVTSDDARSLACNGVTVAGTYVTNAVSGPLRSQIEALGLNVLDVDVDEFLKAGGGVRCLTLELPGKKGDLDDQ